MKKGTLNKAALASNGPAMTGDKDAPAIFSQSLKDFKLWKFRCHAQSSK